MSAGLWDDLVDAELEVLNALGVGVYRTASLDGEDPAWLPKQRVLLVGTDLTPEAAEEVACEVLGIVSELLAGEAGRLAS